MFNYSILYYGFETMIIMGLNREHKPRGRKHTTNIYFNMIWVEIISDHINS